MKIHSLFLSSKLWVVTQGLKFKYHFLPQFFGHESSCLCEVLSVMFYTTKRMKRFCPRCFTSRRHIIWPIEYRGWSEVIFLVYKISLWYSVSLWIMQKQLGCVQVSSPQSLLVQKFATKIRRRTRAPNQPVIMTH